MANNISGINPTGTPSALDVRQAGEQAISFKEQLPDLVQKLREALTSKFQESPLWGQYQTAGQQFMAAPQQIRADISQMQRESGVPLSPTQQGAIESGRRAAAYAPLQTSSMMLGQAMGGLEGMIGRGVGAFEAAAGAQSERANFLNQLRQQEIERQFREREFALKQAGGGLTAYQQLQVKEQEAKKKQLEDAEGFAVQAIKAATTVDEVNTIIAALSKEITDPSFVSNLILSGQKRAQEIQSEAGWLSKLWSKIFK